MTATATEERTQNRVAPEPEPVEPLGNMHLFLPEDYEVTEVKLTLGGINIDGKDWDGPVPKVGESFNLMLRDVKVTGAKPTHKGEVTLILTGTEMRRSGR